MIDHALLVVSWIMSKSIDIFLLTASSASQSPMARQSASTVVVSLLSLTSRARVISTHVGEA